MPKGKLNSKTTDVTFSRMVMLQAERCYYSKKKKIQIETYKVELSVTCVTWQIALFVSLAKSKPSLGCFPNVRGMRKESSTVTINCHRGN